MFYVYVCIYGTCVCVQATQRVESSLFDPFEDAKKTGVRYNLFVVVYNYCKILVEKLIWWIGGCMREPPN